MLGPDNFPDLVAGQNSWVHVNKSGILKEDLLRRRGAVQEWRGAVRGARVDRVALDRLRHVHVREARAYRRGETSEEARHQRLQALAFAYGYLGHMMADGFAHSYVNEWARSVFDIRHNNPGALYGPPTEEIQHMAVEGFIDAHMPPVAPEDLEIDYPGPFLTMLFTAPITVEDRTIAPGGSFAGPYTTALVQLRSIFDILSHRENWAGEPAGRAGQ